MEETTDTRRDHWEIEGRLGSGGAGKGREGTGRDWKRIMHPALGNWSGP